MTKARGVRAEDPIRTSSHDWGHSSSPSVIGIQPIDNWECNELPFP